MIDVPLRQPVLALATVLALPDEKLLLSFPEVPV